MRFGLWRFRDRVPWFLLLWTGGLLLLRSPQQSFMAHDEGYYAQQARWILENQDWLTVGWWGDVVYDRTLGLQWLIASSFQVFGQGEGAARLPSMLAGLGAVFLTWRLGLRFSKQRVGWWGAAILAVMPVWMQASRLAIQDIVLVCLELLGIWALLEAEYARGKGQIAWGMLAGATVGLGFMIKSFMVFLPVVALLPYLILEHRRHRHLRNPGLYLGLVLGAIPVTLWLGLSMARYGWLPVEQLFGKLLALSRQDNAFDIPTTPWFYLWNIPANSFPWAFLAGAGGVLCWRTANQSRKWLWLGYPLGLLGLLTLFDTRTWYYPLQLYPFMAMLGAIALTTLAEAYCSPSSRRRRLPIALTWVVGLLGVGLLLVGIGLLAMPLGDLPAAMRAYGWVGVGGGLGWLVPFGVMQRDQAQPWHRESAFLWRMGWLLGPWLAIAAAFLTGLWGNYNPDLKTALQSPPIAPVLQQNAVHFVRPDANPTSVLLTLYTPTLGDRFPDWQAIPPGQYAWMPVPNPAIVGKYAIIAQVRDWQLIKVP